MQAFRGITVTAVVAAVALAAFGSVAPAGAAVISTWNFENLTVSGTAGVAPVATGGTLDSDTGNGTLTGVHQQNSTWSTPAGNASTKSLSANTWSAGDYWQFTSNTTGFSGIDLLFDATRSSTGPADFKVQYSTTGPDGPYADLAGGAYTLTVVTFSTSGNPNVNTPPRFLFDLGSVPALDNNPNASFRLVALAGGSATAGTSRIDNVTVGTNLAIPEPCGAAAAGMAAGLLPLFRRRRSA